MAISLYPIVEPAPSANEQTTCLDLYTRRPDVRSFQGCEVLTKIRAYETEQGWQGLLEWTFTDQAGLPVDLSDCFEGDDSSVDAEEGPFVELALQEVSVIPACKNPLYVEGEIIDAQNGLARAELPDIISDKAGLYDLNWAVKVGGKRRIINRSLLSVAGSLYGATLSTGALSFQEVRLFMRDYREENTLLNDVEFDAPELAHCILQPVRDWNETPPDLSPYDASTFPYRTYWIRGTLGYLYEIAANHYRRNDLKYSAGGVNVADKNKYAEYDRRAQEYLEDWRGFVMIKKAELNLGQCYGDFGSDYDY